MGSTVAEAAVKAALAIGNDGSIDTADAAFKALVISNEEETVNKAVLDAANKAVNKDGYTVAYKQKESPATGDTFTFTAAKYKAGEGADSGKGSISFTLVMTDSPGCGRCDTYRDYRDKYGVWSLRGAGEPG